MTEDEATARNTVPQPRKERLWPASTLAAVHVGRQTILRADGELYGYELLFRDAAMASFATGDGDAATTATILAAFSEFNIEDLLNGRRGFVNLSRSFITGELPLPFGPDQASLEVLETIERDAEAIAGVQRLAAEGYQIVLDDFVFSAEAGPLLELADIVKIDVLALTWDEVLQNLELCRPYNVRFLAEKVEDAEMMQRCIDVGFELFQGYHLGRPETHTTQTLSPSQAQALEILGRLSAPDVTPAQVEDAVLRDPALMYRLLRIANSAATGLTRTVSSIKDTLILVGLTRLRAWLLLLSMSPPGGSDIGLVTALIRASTCEAIARRGTTIRPETAFTLGLLDGLAESLGLSAFQLQNLLPVLSPDLASALAGGESEMRTLLDAVRAYERAEMDHVWPGDIPLLALSESYLDALAWTTEITRDINSA
jgi:EAL and modified HD-GYP domain-containing signal transduction protein